MDVDSSPVEDIWLVSREKGRLGVLRWRLLRRARLHWLLSRCSVLREVSQALLLLLVSAGCASQFLRFEGSERALKIDEFDREQKIFEIPTAELIGPPEPVRDTVDQAESKSSVDQKPTSGPSTLVKKRTAPKAKPAIKSKEIVPVRRAPEIEDEEGFVGRRPQTDPFRVGEEIVFDISYWGIDAGELVMRVLPFVSVNGRKAYRFQTTARTVSLFESIYKVNDVAEAYLDFDEMRPLSYRLNIKETNQLGNSRAIHDWKSGLVRFWEKKVTKEGRVEEKKLEWEADAFAQNAFSSIWYLRTFQLKVGKSYKFWVAHENENLLIECEVLRQETLSTDQGKFEAVVVRPKATKNGEPHSIGDNLFWMSADDRKLPLRIESKIKIGKIVGSLARIAKADSP